MLTLIIEPYRGTVSLEDGRVPGGLVTQPVGGEPPRPATGTPSKRQIIQGITSPGEVQPNVSLPPEGQARTSSWSIRWVVRSGADGQNFTGFVKPCATGGPVTCRRTWSEPGQAGYNQIGPPGPDARSTEPIHDPQDCHRIADAGGRGNRRRFGDANCPAPGAP